MKVIHKAPLLVTDQQMVKMPKGAVILTVAIDYKTDEPALWYMFDKAIDPPMEHRFIHVVGTGHDFELAGMTFLGTVVQGPFVWHIFEDANARSRSEILSSRLISRSA